MEIVNRSNSSYASWAFGSRIIESLIPATTNYNTVHGSLFFAPPPPPPSPYFSYPPYNYKGSTTHSVFNPQTAPPLLPLPTNIKPNNNTLPSRTKSLNPSPSPTTTRKQKPLTPKKSPKKPQTRKEHSDPTAKPSKQQVLVAATIPFAGPDPNKGGDKVLKKTTPFTGNNSNARESGFERFSGSVAFPLISPPPSSLPLPRFSMRPKRIGSCTAEAAGNIIVDAGAATDSLRQLLRLR